MDISAASIEFSVQGCDFRTDCLETGTSFILA